MSDRMGEEVARNAEALADEDVRLPSLGKPTGRRFLLATEHTGGTVYTAEWWCAWCPTSHPNEAAMRKHAAVEHPNQLSTSALLRQLQQDLAASQADLTRALRERDEADARWEQAFDRLTAERDEAKATARRWREQFHEADESEEKALERWRAEVRRRDLALAELASARAELEQLREYAAISARVIRERNADRRAVWQALGIDTLAPPPDAAEAIRDLISELEQLRAQLAARPDGGDQP